MYTGIIRALFEIKDVVKKPGLTTFSVVFDNKIKNFPAEIITMPSLKNFIRHDQRELK